MEGVYVRWTIENLVTVGLMAAIIYSAFAIGAQLFLSVKAGPAQASLRVVA